MPKALDSEIEESFDREGLLFDEEDEDLLRHVFLEDAPPQGLHQGGYKEFVRAQEDDYLSGF